MSVLEIRLPSLADVPAVRAAQCELAADDFRFAFALGDDARAWVDRCHAQACGEQVPDGWVRTTYLLGLVEDEVTGRVSVRHELTAGLREDGGHVGYGVRPGHRRRGYARELLRHGLDLLAADGVERALLTCADDNHGSIATIEGAGGELRDVRVLDDGEVQRRYLVPTAVADRR